MFTGELRPYQGPAMERAAARGRFLLAHIMGAGKTPTAIATIEKLAAEGKVHCCLVVVMSGIKYQWQSAVQQFCDGRSIVIDGTAAQRRSLYKLAPLSRYVILSYGTVTADWKYVRRLPYDCVLLDEGSLIKNSKAQRTRTIKKLGDGIKYRFAMTGTPIENRPEDLFSIMEFVDPSVLGDPETFERTFIVRDGNGRFKYARNLKTLHRALSDAMDRKSFEEIKQWMPEVVHKKYPVMLDGATRKVYNVIRGDLLDRLNVASKMYGGSFNVLAHYGHADSDGNDQARGDIAARMGALSMLCDSPELLRLSADAFDDDDTKFGSAYAAELKALGLLEGLPELSPKLRAFNEVIDNILTEDPTGKIVVFSFYKPMLYMAQRTTKHRSVLFTGGMPDRAREASRLAFMRDPHVKLFLSSDAGGYGVDLPMAQNLISLDLPWSAGKMDQRNSRIIRTSSQYKYVVNSRIVVAGSIEEWKSDVVLDKRNLGAAFIDGKFDKHGTYTPTAQSLRKFLQEAQV